MWQWKPSLVEPLSAMQLVRAEEANLKSLIEHIHCKQPYTICWCNTELWFRFLFDMGLCVCVCVHRQREKNRYADHANNKRGVGRELWKTDLFLWRFAGQGKENRKCIVCKKRENGYVLWLWFIYWQWGRCFLLKLNSNPIASKLQPGINYCTERCRDIELYEWYTITLLALLLPSTWGRRKL